MQGMSQPAGAAAALPDEWASAGRAAGQRLTRVSDPVVLQANRRQQTDPDVVGVAAARQGQARHACGDAAGGEAGVGV